MLVPGRRDTWPGESVRAQWRALEDFKVRVRARARARIRVRVRDRP
jgi:hypothetical protein